MPSATPAEGIPARLEKVRNELGMSLRVLARDLRERTGYEISHDSVRQYESGRSVPVEYVRALCLGYGLSAEWLLFGTGSASGRGARPGRPSAEALPGAPGPRAGDPEGTRTRMERALAAWRRFIAGLDPDHPVRPLKLTSAPCPHGRSNGDGTGRRPPEETRRRIRACAPLLDAALPHLRWLDAFLGSIPHVVHLADADGVIIHARTPFQDLLDRWGLHPGHAPGAPDPEQNPWRRATVEGEVTASIGLEPDGERPGGCISLAAPVRGADDDALGTLVASTTLDSGVPGAMASVAYVAQMIEKDLRNGR